MRKSNIIGVDKLALRANALIKGGYLLQKLDHRGAQSLTSKVFAHIRDGIIEGRYRTGEYLFETKLAEELGVSRTPVREALKQLELEDLVENVLNRGVIVKGISDEDIEDIFTIRYLLEGLAAFWAAQRMKQSELDSLLELIELMELYTRREDYTKLTELDTRFHDTIFKASNSRTLRHILFPLHQNAHHARQSSLSSPARPMKSLEEHKQIYDALAQRDCERAKSCMEQHVKRAGAHHSN